MSALDELFWRDELLEALFWMRGEGLASSVSPLALADFLAVDPGVVATHMARLADEGFLDGSATGYALTEAGAREGGRSFADEFADLTRPGHGECVPGCTCADPNHAEKLHR